MRTSPRIEPEPPSEPVGSDGQRGADATDDTGADDERQRFGLHLFLFVATTLSVLGAGARQVAPEVPDDPWAMLLWLGRGWEFGVPLMAILLVHELGHYVAARLHRVQATLPYFLPIPKYSLFGTMGAVIAMRGKIRSRNALLDIGASGPLAGLVVAIPVLVYGLSLSPVQEASESNYIQEGQSLLYLALKRLVHGPIPDGHDVFLHPTAFAGWAGLLVTMINLLPWGQLDGGHVAYAMFGRIQYRLAAIFRGSLLVLFLYNAAQFVLPVLEGHLDMPLGVAFSNSAFWLVWFVLLGVIAWLTDGGDHPPTEPGPLSPKRRAVGWITLGFFVLLFMPTPLSFH